MFVGLVNVKCFLSVSGSHIELSSFCFCSIGHGRLCVYPSTFFLLSFPFLLRRIRESRLLHTHSLLTHFSHTFQGTMPNVLKWVLGGNTNRIMRMSRFISHSLFSHSLVSGYDAQRAQVGAGRKHQPHYAHACTSLQDR